MTNLKLQFVRCASGDLSRTPTLIEPLDDSLSGGSFCARGCRLDARNRKSLNRFDTDTKADRTNGRPIGVSFVAWTRCYVLVDSAYTAEVLVGQRTRHSLKSGPQQHEQLNRESALRLYPCRRCASRANAMLIPSLPL